MVLSRVKFEAAVLELGLVSEADWQQFLGVEDPAQGLSAERLAIALVERGHLTNYQANEILWGRGTPLVLDDYVVTDRLGAGNMGAVFKAWHRRLERVVAIKVVAPQLTSVEAAVKRFQREARAAARLIHPNIVTTFDAGEAHGHQYLVMEFVEGQDLGKLSEAGPLPLPRTLHYLLQAAEGLEYAHASGVIHRDIKPANLFIDRRDRLKILDMGIAQLTHGTTGDGLTQTGFVMGTVDYMAPEQGNDIRTVDARCDIYSLGCTLFRLLTGKVMYDGDTFMQRFQRHVADPIPSLRAGCPEATAELERVFRRMVAKQRNDRFADMAAVHQALLAVQQSLATQTANSRGTGSLMRGILNHLLPKGKSGTNLPQRPAAEPPTSPDSAVVDESLTDQAVADEAAVEGGATAALARSGTMLGTGDSETNANSPLPPDPKKSTGSAARHWQQKPASGSSPHALRGTNSELTGEAASPGRRRRLILGLAGLGAIGIAAVMIFWLANSEGGRPQADPSRDVAKKSETPPAETPSSAEPRESASTKPKPEKAETPSSTSPAPSVITTGDVPPAPPPPPKPDYGLRAWEKMNDQFKAEFDLLEKTGMTPQLKERLEPMVPFYQGFLQEHQNDPQLPDELAKTNYHLGWLNEHLLSIDEGVPRYDAAREEQARLLAETPESSNRIEALGFTLYALGRIYDARKDFSAAKTCYVTAVDVRSKLAKVPGASTEHRRQLIVTYQAYANCLRHAGDLQFAKQKMQEAERLSIDAMAADRENLKLRRTRGWLYYDAGNLARQLNELPEFRQYYTKAIDTLKLYLAREPHDIRVRRLLAGCYWDLAGSLNSTYLEQQLEYNREAHRILKQLVEDCPGRTDLQLDLGRFQINRGVAEQSDGRHATALEAFTLGRDTLQPFVDKPDVTPTTRRNYGMLLRLLGTEQLTVIGKREEGIQNLRQARDALAGLKKEFPSNQDYRTQHNLAEQALKKHEPTPAPPKAADRPASE